MLTRLMGCRPCPRRRLHNRPTSDAPSLKCYYAWCRARTSMAGSALAREAAPATRLRIVKSPLFKALMSHDARLEAARAKAESGTESCTKPRRGRTINQSYMSIRTWRRGGALSSPSKRKNACARGVAAWHRAGVEAEGTRGGGVYSWSSLASLRWPRMAVEPAGHHQYCENHSLSDMPPETSSRSAEPSLRGPTSCRRGDSVACHVP